MILFFSHREMFHFMPFNRQNVVWKRVMAEFTNLNMHKTQYFMRKFFSGILKRLSRKFKRLLINLNIT
jgi:hypothetical protein